MKIALCDDDSSITKKLELYIKMFFQQKNIPIEIELFKNGEDFLQSTDTFDIVFMDIYMSNLTGIDTIKQCNQNKLKTLVFVTSSLDFAVEAFNVNATHYLLKPFEQGHIFDALERCLVKLRFLQQENESEKFLEVKTKQLIIPIKISNINYIEVMNKISIIHTNHDEIKTYMTLEHIFTLINDEDFIKAQRSYIVNMHYISQFLFDRVVLKNNQEIKFTRANRLEFKNRYQDFLFRLARREL